MENIIDTLRFLQEEIADLRSELHANRSKVISLEEELIQRNSKIGKLENDIHEDKARSLKLEQGLNDMKNRYNEFSEDITSCRKNITRIETEFINCSKGKITQQRLNATERRTELLDVKVNSAASEMVGIKEQLSALELESNDINNKLERQRKLQCVLNSIALKTQKKYKVNFETPNIQAPMESTDQPYEGKITEDNPPKRDYFEREINEVKEGGDDINKKIDMIQEQLQLSDNRMSRMEEKQYGYEQNIKELEDKPCTCTTSTRKDECMVEVKKIVHDELKMQALQGEVLSILNRLSASNWLRLSTEMMKLGIKTYDDLSLVTNIFYDKATMNTSLTETYAKLCKAVCCIKVPPHRNMEEKRCTFRVVLLIRCQQVFESFACRDPDKKKIEAEGSTNTPERANLDESAPDKSKSFQHFIGNVRFIGELFKVGLLTEKIIHDCIIRLLRVRCHDSLLCVCQLLRTAGKDLDSEKAKQRMDQYFTFMAKLSQERKSEIKDALTDVLDLRKNQWMPHGELCGYSRKGKFMKRLAPKQTETQVFLAQYIPSQESSSQNEDDMRTVDDITLNSDSQSERETDSLELELSQDEETAAAETFVFSVDSSIKVKEEKADSDVLEERIDVLPSTVSPEGPSFYETDLEQLISDLESMI